MNVKTGKRTWLRPAGLLGAAVAAVTVAACASPGGAAAGGVAAGGGQPTVTRSVPPTTPTTPASASALPKASCGSALTHGLNSRTQMLRSDSGALGCFQAAAKTCTAAGLAVTEMGVDTGTSDVFTIEPGGSASGCRVTLWHQSYSANGGGSKGNVGSTACQIGSVTSTGVTLSCAGKQVLIPAKVA